MCFQKILNIILWKPFATRPLSVTIIRMALPPVYSFIRNQMRPRQTFSPWREKLLSSSLWWPPLFSVDIYCLFIVPTIDCFCSALLLLISIMYFLCSPFSFCSSVFSCLSCHSWLLPLKCNTSWTAAICHRISFFIDETDGGKSLFKLSTFCTHFHCFGDLG